MHSTKQKLLAFSLIVFLILCTFCVFLQSYQKYSNALAVSSGESTIQWVDYTVTAQAMSDALKIDIETHDSDYPIRWIDLLAYLACKNGGDFKNYKSSDMESLKLRLQEESLESLTQNLKLFPYYQKAYEAVLGGLVGSYTDTSGKTLYGLKAFSPIASGYGYSSFDDFGVSRTYGYKRKHLGHDMMCSVGTPIIAVESGIVEAVGWNQYGGWRVGIRSFDGKRYWYYAHLRKNHPYNDLYEGKVVTAGEVIGYAGMTGYSAKENVNNINTPHLHIGLQLIFEPSQKDGYNQIWISLYELCEFLKQNKSSVEKNEETNEYYAKNPIYDPAVPD